MLCLKAPLKRAQEALDEARKENAFAAGFERRREGNFFLIPVTRKFGNYSFCDCEAEKVEEKRGNLKEAMLKTGFSETDLRGSSMTFDSVGQVALIEIPESLFNRKKEIGKLLMRENKRVKTVLRISAPFSGEYRIRGYEVIAGENTTVAECREGGCVFKVDLAKAYFSPRLSFERLRIAKDVKEGERILVLFAGVGPFAIVIARKAKPSKVVAVELNQDAFEEMRENIKRNKVSALVEPVLGDAKNAPLKYANWADRIAMPLPKSSFDFLPQAFECAGKGCIIHFYCLAEKGEWKKAFLEAEKLGKSLGKKISLMGWRVARGYSPSVDQLVLDLKVE
jgi:tRNA (guanine37-N1)-methyltransferase